jgi:hypothetical protein
MPAQEHGWADMPLAGLRWHVGDILRAHDLPAVSPVWASRQRADDSAGYRAPRSNIPRCPPLPAESTDRMTTPTPNNCAERAIGKEAGGNRGRVPGRT